MKIKFFTAVIAATLFAFVSTSAQARTHHRHHAARVAALTTFGTSCDNDGHCWSSGTVEPARRQRGETRTAHRHRDVPTLDANGNGAGVVRSSGRMVDSARSPMPGTESSPNANPSSADAAPRSWPAGLKTSTLACTLSTMTNGRVWLSPESRTQFATCRASLDALS